MSYIIYCRKSSEEDSEQVQSLDTQQRLLLEFAQKEHLQIVDIIRESKSARTDQNRPLFAQMLARIQKGEARAILTIHTDRLARNFIDAGFIIKLIEAGTLKEVRTPTTTYSNAPSLLYMGFDFVFASHYSRDLSVKVRAGNQSKLLKGDYPSYAPLGYVNIPPGRGIAPDPIRAPLIQRTFKLYASGDHSVKSLAKLMREEGLRSRSGKPLVTACIYRMLTNPEYYGVIRRKGKLYQGTHTTLITKNLFDQVQDIINQRSRPRKQIHSFTYRDFLVYDVCGCKLTAGISKGKYIYYRCTNGKGNCAQHRRYWNDDHIKNQLAGFFTQFTLDKEKAEASFNLYKQSLLSEENHQTTTITVLDTQIDRLQKRLARLEDMLIDERISEERYDEKKQSIQNELVELQTLKKQTPQTESIATLELVAEIKNQAVKLSEIFLDGDDEVRRDLVQSVLWNCGFTDGKITSTRLTKLWKPLENLNLTADLNKWRRGRDSNSRFFRTAV